MIRPTVLGWKALPFFAALVAAFYAAPYQNLYFLRLAFLCVLAVLNVHWTIRNVSGATGDIAPLAAFPAGSAAPVRFRIDAAGRRRLDLLVVLDLGERGRCEAPLAVVHGTAEAFGEIRPLPRGVHAVRAAWVESSYPLGLLRVRRPLAAPREIVVHPAPAQVPNAPGGGVAGIAAAIGAVPGTDQPSGVREFRSGDEIRDVHWRATARLGRPVVTEWDSCSGDGLELVLDLRADEHALEGALSVVAALALAARDTKERLTVHTQGSSRTYGPGHVPWDELLRFLAGARALPADGPAPPPAATTVLRLPSRREKVPA